MASALGAPNRLGSVRAPLTEAKGLAAGLPDLLIEARRVATTVLSGWHGRRRAGPGEAFWKFRHFESGEAHTSIDWRRSARDDHLYVREKEWEAAHTVWLSVDLSSSMLFRSRLSRTTKRDRAVVLLLALAELLASAGERIGLLGLGDPTLARNAAERLAATLARHDGAGPPLPATTMLKRFSDVVLFGDFLDPLEGIEQTAEAIAASGARAHLVQVNDPIEETFPYTGRIEFRDPESGLRHVVTRAELYREEYQALLAERRDRIALLCRRLDWTFLVHRTDHSAATPLLALHARLSGRHEGVGTGRSAGARAA